MTLTHSADAGTFRYQAPQRLTSLSVVMPAHNEAENIETAIIAAMQAASRVADRYEVVVVDDGSTDATAAIVEALSAVHGNAVRLIRNPTNLGYGPTVRRAWDAARMDWILFTDSDCQFDLEELPSLVELADGADIVTGWRRNRQDATLRKINAKVFNIAGRVMFGTGVRDIDCAFKLMRTSALRRLTLTAKSAMINTELLYQARQHGLRVAEAPVTHLERRFGKASGGDLNVILRAVREFFAMRHRFNRPERNRLRLHSWLVGLVSLLAGVAAAVWAVGTHVVLAYGDAEAHLNIAKRVVSGLTNGLAQLGSVWLPLPHLLMLPFVANDAMWRSGIAGALIGVPALVLLAVTSFRLANLLTASIAASWLAPLVIISNPNMLYLSVTPMTEVLLLAMVATSVYFLARWTLHDGLSNLVFAGLFGSLASLARYDGWALVCIEAVAVLLVAIVRHRSRRSVEGLFLLFGVLAFSGIAGWLLWNQLIFSDPLYFARSTYGSAEQQQFFLKIGLLPTYHDWGKSTLYWFEDVRIVIGMPIGVLAVIGLVILVINSAARKMLGPVLIAGITLSCCAFYILSLYLGQASLILPRLTPPGSPYNMSNIRYAVQALLPVAVFIAYLGARWPRVLAPILTVAVLAHAGYLVDTKQVMAFEDGTRGLSSQSVSKGIDSPIVENWLRRNYNGGLVLMDDYRRPVGPVESGVPMSQFIGTGNKPYWLESLANPAKYPSWIILQMADTDAVWTGFSPMSRNILADHFVEVFRSGGIHVFKRRLQVADIVVKQGQHLYLAGKRWNSVGVNTYDLLEQPQSVIDDRLDHIAQGAHNTIRTWCFDKDGGISNATLQRLAVTVNEVHKRGLKLVCTLANSLPDYGGQRYFTTIGDEFYADTSAATRYEDQVRRLLEYRGVDGVRLADNPAILAWDLINEPRVNAGAPQTSVRDWVERMGEFVGSIDQLHLITVGSEGFGGGYPADPKLAGPSGSELATLCTLPSITLCSVHLYPTYLRAPLNSAEIGDVLQGWRVTADSAGKPVIVEEAGYAMSEAGGFKARQNFFDDVARAINNSDLDGGLLWNVGPSVDESFTLQYGDPTSERTLSAWSNTIRKSP